MPWRAQIGIQSEKGRKNFGHKLLHFSVTPILAPLFALVSYTYWLNYWDCAVSLTASFRWKCGIETIKMLIFVLTFMAMYRWSTFLSFVQVCIWMNFHRSCRLMWYQHYCRYVAMYVTTDTNIIGPFQKQIPTSTKQSQIHPVHMRCMILNVKIIQPLQQKHGQVTVR